MDAELRQAHARNLGVDLLNESGHRPNGGTQTDSALTRDRALLKTNSGGAGIRPIGDRPHALNSMCHALPMLIDKKDKDGNVTAGYFNALSSVFGEDSFDELNKATRWNTFLSRNRGIALEFKQAYDHHSAINLEVRARIDLPPGSDPPASIFDKPIDGFGADNPKVQKSVMEERQLFRAQVVHQRMCALPCDDHRRKAWLANSADEFACSTLGQPDVLFSTKRWHASVALFFGLPVKELAPYIGNRIQAGGSGNPVVDAHGHNLLSLPHSLGGGTSTHHNNSIRVVSEDLGRAGVKVKTTSKNGGVNNLFKGPLSGGLPLGDRDRDITNGIIPDMVVDASEFENSAGSELGGAVHLVDMKTHASTSDHNSDSTTRGQVAKNRQDKVNSAYFKKAKWLDHVVHGSHPDEQGPVERELHEYGHNGRVLGPVIGVYGCGSSDLSLLRDLAAFQLARKHTEHHNMDFFQARAMFKKKLNRSWGQHIARGWASMLLNRLRDYVIPSTPSCTARPAYSDHYGPNSGVVNDQFNYFHGLARGVNQGG